MLFQGKRAWLTSLIGGLMLPLAFAPFGIWPLIFVSLAIFFYALVDVTPKTAFVRAWIFGLGMFGFGASWVVVSMHYYGGIGIPLATILTSIFVMFLALFPGVLAWFSRRGYTLLGQRRGMFLILILPILWVFFEWIRSWVLTGFPWLNLGYSQIDSPLLGYAPVLGVYGISLVTAFTTGLILHSILERSTLKRNIAVLAALWLVPLGFNLVDWSTPTGNPITVSMIQGNIPQDQKWLPSNQRPQLDMYAQLSRENWTSDLVIWPETAVPALYEQALPYLNYIGQEARMNNSELLVGIPVFNDQDNQYFNAMLSLGNEEAFYEKKHLVPFGEYLPMAGLLGGFIDFFDIPMSNFSPGRSEKPILHVAGQKAGISICYEDAFGEEIIDALPEATFLVNASNDAWFGRSVAPHQHLEIARMRAVETARFLLRSTNTGISAVIDPQGKVVAQSPQFKRDVLTHTIQPMQGASIYAIFGNIPIVSFLFIALFGTLTYQWYQKRDSEQN